MMMYRSSNLSVGQHRQKQAMALLMGVAMLLSLAPFAVAATPEQERFFETNIRPVLIEQCASCHGAEKQKGGFRVDGRESFFKGSESGPVVAHGNPDASLLIDLIRYTNQVKMPPKKKLPDETVKLFEEWVKMGAPWPAEVNKPMPVTGTEPPKPDQPKRDPFEEARETLWALRPVTKPAPPVVKNSSAVGNDVDRFILAKLESKGITASPLADRQTLIRRITFDLTGLPPTYEEAQAFINDKAPDAWANVIDRLLASPQYGERWGRHWLDIARYADTKGYVFTQDRRYPFSYTYRDYVIRAFNEDKPFDRFIIEQIAADKIDTSSDKRDLAAMGFLTVGRRFNNNIHDITDDRIDVVTRGFLGLTVVCARCHDHKYDPIPTADYYSLYGVFRSSVEPDDLPLIGDPNPSNETKAYEAERAKREREVENYLETVRQNIENEMRQRSGDYLVQIVKNHPNHTQGPAPVQSARGEMRIKAVDHWEQYLSRRNKENDPVWAPWHKLIALKKENFKDEAAKVIASFDGEVNEKKAAINPVILDHLRKSPPQSMEQVAQMYGSVLEGVEKSWRSSLKDKAGDPPKSMASAEEEQLRQVYYSEGSPAVLSRDESAKLINRAERDHERNLARKVDELTASHPGAPARAMVMNDGGMFNPYIFLRGQQDRRGTNVDRRFLQVLSPVDGGKPFKQGSGRLELAQAIASKSNPLTARVFVNRVWQKHFGSGFVADGSDFGTRSEPPEYAALLDHLATFFMDQNWSVKKLHKHILLSRTYQQASDHRSDAAAIDSENFLFWKMNRQRLELEPMRDAMLFVAGRLDLSLGGRPVKLFDQPYPTRRTVYGYIDRQDLPSVYRVFDLATPDASSASRPQTTVPQQALYMMNNPFVAEQALKLIERIEVKKHPADLDRNITLLYQFIYSRQPAAGEIAIGKAFIAQESPDGEGKAWEKYARALLLSNEFVFID